MTTSFSRTTLSHGVNNNNNNNNKTKLKYKNSSIEIQRMWNMNCFVIPVIIGATGIVTKGLKKYVETIPKKAFHRLSTKKKQQF
jgi:hypothetical protein